MPSPPESPTTNLGAFIEQQKNTFAAMAQSAKQKNQSEFTTALVSLGISVFSGVPDLGPLAAQVGQAIWAQSASAQFAARLREIEAEELEEQRLKRIADLSVVVLQGLLKELLPQLASNEQVTLLEQKIDSISSLPSTFNESHILLTLEEYKASLQRREEEVREQLTSTLVLGQKEPRILELEKEALENKLTNIETSYQERISQLQEDITRLRNLQGQVPQDQLNQAIETLRRGETTKVEQLLEHIKQQAIQAAQKNLKLAAEAAYQQGRVAEDQSQYVKAQKYYEEAIRWVQDNAEYLFAAGSIANTLGAYDQAIEYYQQSLEIKRKFLGDDHLSVAQTYNNLGAAWFSRGAYDQAIEFYQRSLEIKRKFLGDDHPSVADTYNNLGAAWSSKGAYDKAIGFYRLSFELMRKSFGDDHFSVARIYNNLGNTWRKKDAYDQALWYYRLSLELMRKSFGDDHPSVADTYNNLGTICSDKGEYNQAIEYYQRSLEIKHKSLRNDHPSVAIIYNNLGAAWSSKGAYDKAIEYYQQSLEITRHFLGDDHPSVAMTYGNLGNAYKDKGNPQKAKMYYEQSLAIFEARLGPAHSYTQQVQRLLKQLSN